MMTISLFKELSSQGFVTTIEITNVRRCSSETNKLRYVHSIRGSPRNNAIKEQEINDIKIEIVLFIIEVPFLNRWIKSRVRFAVLRRFVQITQCIKWP